MENLKEKKELSNGTQSTTVENKSNVKSMPTLIEIFRDFFENNFDCIDDTTTERNTAVDYWEKHRELDKRSEDEKWVEEILDDAFRQIHSNAMILWDYFINGVI